MTSFYLIRLSTRGGRGVKKVQKPVYVVIECPQGNIIYGYSLCPPDVTSLFWSTFEMLLMIKTMKSGLKLQVHIWSNLSKGGWEGEFWGWYWWWWLAWWQLWNFIVRQVNFNSFLYPNEPPQKFFQYFEWQLEADLPKIWLFQFLKSFF